MYVIVFKMEALELTHIFMRRLKYTDRVKEIEKGAKILQ